MTVHAFVGHSFGHVCALIGQAIGEGFRSGGALAFFMTSRAAIKARPAVRSRDVTRRLRRPLKFDLPPSVAADWRRNVFAEGGF
jgi:hypothetical protein